MTEAEWLACKHPLSMFHVVRGGASDRRFRLFACACYRSSWPSISDERGRRAVELAEQYADGGLSWDELTSAERSSHPACWHLTCKTGEVAAFDVVDDAWLEYIEDEHALEKIGLLTALFRDIFGNPFTPVTLHPDWLTPTVVSLARQMYGGRDFSPMPVLADALQDAGCEDEAVLTHCRGDGPHVRGCWVVDLLLGKA